MEESKATGFLGRLVPGVMGFGFKGDMKVQREKKTILPWVNAVSSTISIKDIKEFEKYREGG